MNIKIGDYVEVRRTTVENDVETTLILKGKVCQDSLDDHRLSVGGTIVFNKHDGSPVGSWEVITHRPGNPPEPGICGLVRTRNRHLWINLDGGWHNLADTAQQTDDYDSLDVAFVVFEGGDREFTRKSMGLSMTHPRNPYN